MMENNAEQTSPPGAPAGWSEEDQAWFLKLPEVHQRTARRWGRQLWAAAMNAGIAGHSLGIVLQHNRGNRTVMAAVQVLQQVLNELVKQALKAQGFQPKDLQDCQKDIETVASLATVGGQKGNGRIILPS